MGENLQEISLAWRESFGYFSDDSLHLLAKIYLTNAGLQKIHSRELIIEALWHHANRDEFSQASLESLSSFDTQLLLLLYLGLHSVEQLAESLASHSCIEICFKLLHLQERMLVLRSTKKSSKSTKVRAKVDSPSTSQSNVKVELGKEAPMHLIPKIEKQLESSQGACFFIAPQFYGQLQNRLDFCSIFSGLRVPATPKAPIHREEGEPAACRQDLLLSAELVLASALYFAQEGFFVRRKIRKAQLSKCLECFPQLNEELLIQLRDLSLSCGLLRGNEQSLVQFSIEVFAHLWRVPYYQRLLSLQADIAQLAHEAFAKLLSIWPEEVWLPAAELQHLLTLMGIPADKTGGAIRTMFCWNILLSQTASEMRQKLESCGIQHDLQESFYYQINPLIFECIIGTSLACTASAEQIAGGSGSQEKSVGEANRLSSNWELFCDLRHPESYIELLLCARLKSFGELSLFRIEKRLFQKYFNAEKQKFDYFLQHSSQLERSGIHVSDLVQQQWKEWFNDSTRFQLFKNCVLICQPSYNELIVRLLGKEDTEGRVRSVTDFEDQDILCNPQAGVFYLNEKHCECWRSSLSNAGIQLSEPFGQNQPHSGQAGNWASTIEKSQLWDWDFPIHNVIHQWQRIKSMRAADQKKLADQLVPQQKELPHLAEEALKWGKWPTNPTDFIQSRQLVCSNSDLSQLHIHFREARGVDYTAKRNLLYSLLTARNHMAIITVAEGEELDLVSYLVLPLNLDGPKGDPKLLALDLGQQQLTRFCVKNITRVNEVFYSVINVCLLSLLPSKYIYQLEERFRMQDEELSRT